MKTNLIFLFLLNVLGIQLPSPTENHLSIEGVWEGKISQSPAGISSEYDFSMLIRQNENSLVGTTMISLKNEPNAFGEILFHGSMNEKEIEIEETEINQQSLFENAYWCLKEIKLTLDEKGDFPVLVGSWESDYCNGSSGEIRLIRIEI